MIIPKPQNIHRADRFAGMFEPAVVDIFAGCGGASIGIEQAFCDGGYRDKYVDLMVNHWDVAVGVHQANHPMTVHLHANVLEVDPDEVLLGRQIVYLHASPDCTDHSKAKGGKPRRKEIRALADVVIVWARKRRPLFISLENVEEFAQWGPLLKNGQPDKRKRGHEFKRWKGELEQLGYQVDHRELRACDYGAPTTRKRLFVIARCDGKQLVWPNPTHGKVHHHAESQSHECRRGNTDAAPNRSNAGSVDFPQGSKSPGNQRLASVSAEEICNEGSDDCSDFRQGQHQHSSRKGEHGSCGFRKTELVPFRTAAECIDWNTPMLSIFATRPQARAWAKNLNVGREKHERVGVPQRPLQINTHKRLAGGLWKWVLNNAKPFIVRLGHGEKSNGVARWGQPTHSVDAPLPTVTGSKDFGVADVELAPFTSTLNHGGDEHRAADLREPLQTVTGANDARALVAPVITEISDYGWNGDPSRSIDTPLSTVTAGPRGGKHVVTAVALNKHYSGVIGQAVDEPIGTVTSVDHHSLLAVHLTQYHTEKSAETRSQSVDEPLKTLDTQNRFGVASAYMVKFRGDSVGTPADEPMPTVTSGAGAARDAGAAHALGVAAAYMSHMYTSNTCGGQGDPNKPLKTITSGGQHANACVVYLSPYYGNAKEGHTPADPMPTVVGHDRFGLAAVQTNPFFVLTQSALRRARQVGNWARKMLGKKVQPYLLRVADEAGKVFHLLTATVGGALHLVTDILMRMLKPRELARAQGFDDSYVIDKAIDGTRISKADQVKLIGNSVPPAFMRAIVAVNVVAQGLLDLVTPRAKRAAPRKELVPA